jgi:hypothetical protein
MPLIQDKLVRFQFAADTSLTHRIDSKRDARRRLRIGLMLSAVVFAAATQCGIDDDSTVGLSVESSMSGATTGQAADPTERRPSVGFVC